MLMLLDRKSGESASAYAKRVLVFNIVHLKLLPGEQLQEKQLAEAIGVSRTPVREAILELKRSKVINIYPQRGTFISYIEHKPVEDIRYLRYVFETELAVQMCAVASDEAILRMQENVQMQNLCFARNMDRFMDLDDAFHGEIYRSCGRQMLGEIVAENAIHFDRMRRMSYNLSTSKELIDEHAAILDAIRAKDVVSVRGLYQKHLTRAIADHKSLRKQFPEYYAPDGEE